MGGVPCVRADDFSGPHSNCIDYNFSLELNFKKSSLLKCSHDLALHDYRAINTLKKQMRKF